MDALRLSLALVADAPRELDLGRYLTTCGVLIALIVGFGWIFRRFIGGAIKKRASERSLEVVDMLPLGGRQKLCVVRCYDRTFVLGLGSDVSLVAELDESSVELPETPTQDPSADRRAFARELLRVHSELVESEQASPVASPKPATSKPPASKQSNAAATPRPQPVGQAPKQQPRPDPVRPEPQDVQRLRQALSRPEGVLG